MQEEKKSKCRYCNDALDTDNQILRAGLEAFHQEDFDKAFALLLPLAEQNIITAQCRVGTSYQLELGTTVNGTKAIKWFLSAGHQGCPLAYNNLATIYCGTLPDIPRDDRMARECWRKAVANGFDMVPASWMEEP
jgi:TPR repeat protein